MILPNFFIVGAPKCGTTAMYKWLKQHPEVFLPAQKKEPHFFGNDLRLVNRVRTEQEYLSLFAEARGKKRVGEASVFYLYSKLAAGEIKSFNPNAMIIIMVRNPVDMLYSLHSQLLYSGDEDVVDFEAALAAEGDRERGLRVPSGSHVIDGLFYRAVARFTGQIRRYVDVFGRENVHVIVFDDLKRNPADVYKKTLRFLDIIEDFEPKFDIVNANKRVRSRTVMDFLQHVPPVFKMAGRLLMPRALRVATRGAITRLNTEYAGRGAMDPVLRKRLQTEFVPEVESLSELLGRDLTHWCDGRPASNDLSK